MKKLMFIIFLLLFINLIGADIESLPSQKVNNNVELKQVGADFSACNITSVSYQNTSAFVQDVVMTKRGNEYNYTLNSSYVNKIGRYTVNGFCTNGSDDIVWAYDFEATYTGEVLDTQTSILYVVTLSILVFFLIFTLIGVTRLPRKDIVTEDNLIIDINKLKYLRPVLYMISWMLLLAIIFITSSISIAYLPDSLIGEFFFMIYTVMFTLTLPIVVVWFIYLFYRIFKDREMKKLIERGVQVRSSII